MGKCYLQGDSSKEGLAMELMWDVKGLAKAFSYCEGLKVKTVAGQEGKIWTKEPADGLVCVDPPFFVNAMVKLFKSIKQPTVSSLPKGCRAMRKHRHSDNRTHITHTHTHTHGVHVGHASQCMKSQQRKTHIHTWEWPQPYM